jgi:hypothetical protein
LIDTGLLLSYLIDSSVRDNRGNLKFIPSDSLRDFHVNGPTQPMLKGLKQGKGRELIRQLKWLTEASILQQSITYGDYTAEIAEKVLYDRQTRSLQVHEGSREEEVQKAAITAMQANPLLARNVVMLAMRHTIADALEGNNAEAILFRQTFYQLALKDFVGESACKADPMATQRLSELFPNWKFEYRVTLPDKNNDKGLEKCPEEMKHNTGVY